MKLLILTQYYPPEIGAPQNRLHELAVRLQKNGVEVEVLTAMPNYPTMEIFEAYRNNKVKEENIDGIKVYRSSIFVSRSKKITARLRNYFSFVWSSYWRGRKLENYDVLLVESPPLFLGYSAMALAKKLKAKLIFNVSDLWPESAEKLDIVSNKRLLKLAYNLEAKCYGKAKLVTGQTQGIVKDIQTRFPEKDVFWLPNGVDTDFYNPKKIESGWFREKNNFSKEDKLFFYGGILGHAQGLEVILRTAEKFKQRTDVKFILQGAGPEKESLQKLSTELALNNVYFLDPLPKKEMPLVLKDIDFTIVPLKKLDLFLGAIPSKIFECIAMEVPLLLGVDGEARDLFIEQGKAGLFFEPENVEELSKCINEVLENSTKVEQLKTNARAYAIENFNRDNIAKKFYTKLKEI
ncbi:MAG: glycosyltransferase family 4 protein [Lishizhenia sp.]